MTTIRDVAEYAGVSIGTVSNYISHTKPVSEEKARRIEQAISALHFIPNKSARNLKKQSRDEIGVILPNFNDKYYVDIFYGIHNYFQTLQIPVNIFLSNNDPELERKNIETLLSRPTAGMIIVSCQPNNHVFFDRIFAEKKMPIIEIDRRMKGSKNDFVSFENYKTVKRLTEALLKQNITNIFLFTGPRSYTNENDAILGYEDAFSAMSLIPDENNICTSCVDRESAFKSAAALLARHTVDAVIATSEAFASGIQEALILLFGNSYKTHIVTLGHTDWDHFSKNAQFFSITRSASKLGKKASELLWQRLSKPWSNQRFAIIKDEIKEKDLSIEAFPTFRKNIILSVLMLDNKLTQHIFNLLPHFERKTGIHVDLHTISHKDIYHRISTPHEYQYDALMFNLAWINQLVKDQILFPLDDFLKAANFDRNIYLPNSIHWFGECDRHTYGLPFMYSPQILYYRKDLFTDQQLSDLYKQQYNVSLRTPRTWKEFHHIAKFFSQRHNPVSPTLFGTCIPAAYTNCLVPDFYTRLSFYDASVWDEQNQVQFRSRKTQAAYQDFLSDLKIDQPKFLSSNYVDAARSFISGETAMIITYPSYTTDMIDIGKSEIAGKIGYAHIPGKNALLFGQSFGISNQSHQKEYAWEFIQWLCGKEMAEYITLLSGQTIINDILENDYMLNVYPWLRLFKETWNYAKPLVPPHDQSAVIHRETIDAIIGKYIYAVLDRKMTFEHAFNSTDHELRMLFEQRGFKQKK